MYFISRPDREKINDFLAEQSAADFTYDHVGLTAMGQSPEGYHIHHRQTRIGSGDKDFDAAKSAVRRWAMFDMPKVWLCFCDAPIEPENTVAVLSSLGGLWSLSACRTIYTIDETVDGQHQYGFGYGTLADHVMSGEERFLVTQDLSTGEVGYDLLAFSKPAGLVTRLGLPLVRRFQWGFGTNSLKAMKAAVEASREA